MNREARSFLVAGSLLAGMAVALGAYGAHGLSSLLGSLGYAETLSARLAWYETAIRYQMMHALGLLVLGLWAIITPNRWLRRAGLSFLVGIFLFCGSLLVMTLAGPTWRILGAVVPIGGLSLIAGWLAVVLAALTTPEGEPVGPPQ